MLIYSLQGADTVGTEDRPAEAGQHIEQAAKLTVRACQYDKAADLLSSALNMYSEAGIMPSQSGDMSSQACNM